MTALAKSVQQGLAARIVAEARERLRREGLLDRQKKLAAPADITRLVVIHPVGAAGYADIAGELNRWRAAGILEVLSIPAPFEGAQAVAAMVGALRQAARPSQGQALPDVILLVRGGGARAGLSQLDDESLARTVATLPVLVISGLGHATDRSLVDEVAWKMRDTPSKALALVAGVIREAAIRAVDNKQTIRTAANNAVARANSDLSTLWLRTCSGGSAAPPKLQRSCLPCGHAQNRTLSQLRCNSSAPAMNLTSATARLPPLPSLRSGGPVMRLPVRSPTSLHYPGFASAVLIPAKP